ncbi:uncharacterized protein [Nicotiana tomentosiformis]|uniref:uncharacterized protein n=1 Tax=Nicotiana tomentosiformis TaxID=4098 RepID=UPI00388C7954
MGITIEDMQSSAWLHMIDAKTSYNVLLGRPWINENKVVLSTYHQCLKYYEGEVKKKMVVDDEPFTEAESHFADAKFYLKNRIVKELKADNVMKSKNDEPMTKRAEVTTGKAKVVTEEVQPNSNKSYRGDIVSYGKKVTHVLQYVPKRKKDEVCGPKSLLNVALPTERTDEGFEPNTYRLFANAGYNPNEPSKLGKLLSEATMRQPCEGLGYKQPLPVCISIRRVSSNYITVEDESATSNKPSIFDRLGKSTARTSVFERLGPLKKGNKFQRNYRNTRTPASPKIQKISKDFQSLVPSRMRRQTKFMVSCDEVLKVKPYTVVYTKECDEDKESMGSSYHVTAQGEHGVSYLMEDDEKLEDVSLCYHISFNDGDPQEDKDAKDAPPELEEGVKATIDALKEVNLGTNEEPRPTYLSALLAIDDENTYIKLLKEFKDVFAWSYKDMPGLDLKVAVHHLAVKNGARPVKQAQRQFRRDLVPLIESKVNKLIKAGFIREVKYPTWVSSIVHVRKKNGQIWVCVDFRDLNNACPKDEFPLPILELMIDTTTGCEAMSFIDGSSGYNQIRMAPKDEELTAFCTPKAYLRRFISNLAGRCQLFSRLMKKGIPFKWDQACSNAVESIKTDLMKPPILAAPIPGKPLILYISAQERMMTPNELNYSPIEKLCLALVFSIQKLKHYFQAHVVRLISRANPIKFVMSKPVLSDRLARWYLQFQRFEVLYIPKKAVKGQLLANFLADHPIPDNWELTDELLDEDAMVVEVQPPWKMYFDGAVHHGGAGAGIVFVTSQGKFCPTLLR